MNLVQVDMSGSRIVGALTDFGHDGPKHHGIIVGENTLDGKIYVAENRHTTGYELAAYDDFIERYSPKADVLVYSNDGSFSNYEVAQRALEEVIEGGKGKYNLIVNNCESFSNRAMYDSSNSTQIVNTAIGLLALAGAFWVLSRAK
ncbi:MAG: lecithin retinol acyltransferase family protein [Pseudomonadota bacterium]